ncbi:MAG: DUF302 domain-containing protein [Chloroflexi bacterium]|nr:DUF302 domain-containing protein [Chloroflexota bacterium]
MTTTTTYGITKTVSAGYDETIARVKDLLKEEGFGVLTEIDVRATLKQKLDKEVEPYVILGACNPKLASRALELEPDIGLLLPCNVVVARRAEGTFVGVVNPASMVSFTGNADLGAVSHEADERLRRVIERV